MASSSNNQLVSLSFPAAEIHGTSNLQVALAAVGGIANVHEKCLYLQNHYQTKKQAKQHEVDDDTWISSTMDELFTIANPLIPNRVTFQQMRQDGNFSKKKRHPAGSTIYPVLAGDWFAARLTRDGKDSTMCGAFFWHVATVGSTMEDAAKVIQKDICIAGKAGAYNTNEETDEFVKLGGRIVTRMTWEDDDYNIVAREDTNVCDTANRGDGLDRFNLALPEGDMYKLDAETLKIFRKEDESHGPHFLFTPASMYLDQVWPAIQFSCHEMDDDEEESDNDMDEEDGPTMKLQEGLYVHAFFKGHEHYLAGRLLSTTITYDNPSETDTAATATSIKTTTSSASATTTPTANSSSRATATNEKTQEGTSKQALHMIVIFTYAAPEQLDDAYVGNVPISGEFSKHVTTKESLISFLLSPQTTKEQVDSALNSISQSKNLELFEEVIMRDREFTSPKDRQSIVQRILPALYSRATTAAISPSAPSFTALQNRILIYLMDFDLLNTILVEFRNLGKLTTMIQALQTYYEEQVALAEAAKKKKENAIMIPIPNQPSLLLALAPTPEIASFLMKNDENIILQPTIEVAAATMSRLPVFSVVLEQMLKDATSADDAIRSSSSAADGIDNDNASTNKKDEILWNLAIVALRGLHSVPLDWILKKLSITKRNLLLQCESIEILDPPEPYEFSQGRPTNARGTIGQVALGSSLLSWREADRERPDSDAIKHVMSVIEYYRQQKSQHGENITEIEKTRKNYDSKNDADKNTTYNFDRFFYILNDGYWENFHFLARYERNRDELITTLKKKVIDTIDNFEVNCLPSIIKREGERANDTEIGRLEWEKQLAETAPPTTETDFPAAIRFHAPSPERYWYSYACRCLTENY